MKNLKKATRLYKEATTQKNFKEKLVELARALEIPVSDKALDPRNQRSLQRQGFWLDLKYRAVETLKCEVISFFKKSGDLYVGKEFYSEEHLSVVVEIRYSGVSLENIHGKKSGSHNVLYLPLPMELLPGEDSSSE